MSLVKEDLQFKTKNNGCLDNGDHDKKPRPLRIRKIHYTDARWSMNLPISLTFWECTGRGAERSVKSTPEKRGSGLRRRNFVRLLPRGATFLTRNVPSSRFGGFCPLALQWVGTHEVVTVKRVVLFLESNVLLPVLTVLLTEGRTKSVAV